MAIKPFMEMDLDEFEENDEEVIDEPNLDFDFDEDVEEITPGTDSLSETPSDDDSLEIPEFHKEFIESGKAKKYDGMILGDESGMVKIGRFFNIDEIPAEQKKVNETYKDLASPANGEIVKVIPVATADTDPDRSDGAMDDYIVLYKYKDTFRYAVLQTSTDPDYIGLFAFANDVNGLESAYDFWSKHQIVGKDSSTEQTSSGESTRAQFKDKAYFDEYITKQRERIEKISSEPNSSSESGERMLGNMYMDLISAEYSDGMSKEEISSDVNDMFSHIKTVDSYGAMVDYLSLAILFNISNDKISSILSNDQYDDDLISKLKEALGSTASGEGVRYESYQTFDDMLNDKISSEEFLNYVNNDWYEDSKDRYWYDSHNSSENTYTGYWCWVGAAVAQIKNIDTNGSKYIPSGLISSTPTQEGYVMEAWGETLAKEWIKKPEVIKEINESIDKQFASLYSFGFKPTEAELAENRKKIWAKNIEPHILMSIYAKKAFDEMTKEEIRIESEKMRKEMKDRLAQIMARRDKPTQESFGFGKLPFSRFYQEADEEEQSDDNDETLELPEMPDLDEDESDEETSEDDTTEGESPDGIEGFGMDTSDVQNEFDPKDVESLNKLIAAESEAINDYFDASKDTRDEDLRTLFSDIGHEERFHLEQLLYAKSKLTGEKYEPRDPEVKAEYDELINGGMDEDTAAYTAMDKRSMLGEDDGEDMDELEQESALIYDMLHHNEILTSICEHYMSQTSTNKDKELGVILEAFYQEAIDNVSSAPKNYTKLDSPLTILTKGFKIAVNGLVKMGSVVRDTMRKNKLTRARKIDWLKKHDISDLFKGGIHLYLYDDNQNKVDLDTPCRYVDFLYRLTKAIGESCGVKLTAAAHHKTISNPIKFKNVKEGMYKLSQVIFNKTKVVVTDDNKAALQNEFFGYSDDKINLKVTHGTDQQVNDSGNIYNRLDAVILVTKKYADISIAVLEELKKLEGDVNSIYYKNRPVYNKAMKDIKLVVEKYTQFINAMSHDLTEIMRLDNGLLKLTRERDMVEQGGGKWEGPDIRVNKAAQQGTQYTKRK